MEKLFFMSLGSGSCGNCYYLALENYGILIDVGLSKRRISMMLKKINVNMDSIYGVILTHAHADHIRGANSISNTLPIPFFATEETFNLSSTGYRKQYEVNYSARHIIEPSKPFEIGEFKITAFPLSHDLPCVGYVVEVRDRTIIFASDLGEPSDYLKQHLCDADIAVLESNYDEDMLANGRYPAMLKERIVGANGHLSNTDAAELVEQKASDKLKRLFLCHLSNNNNTPEKALEVMRQHVKGNVQVEALPRYHQTILMEL